MKAWVLLFFVSGAALADDAAMRRCRAVPDMASRVQCYDAIPLAAGATAIAAAAPPAPDAPVAAVSPSPADMQRGFGFETSAKNQPAQLARLDSSIAGQFDGWRPNQRLTLANGQVWQVSDDSDAMFATSMNPKVTVVRGMMGAMYMEIDGARRAPKVRRVE